MDTPANLTSDTRTRSSLPIPRTIWDHNIRPGINLQQPRLNLTIDVVIAKPTKNFTCSNTSHLSRPIDYLPSMSSYRTGFIFRTLTTSSVTVDIFRDSMTSWRRRRTAEEDDSPHFMAFCSMYLCKRKPKTKILKRKLNKMTLSSLLLSTNATVNQPGFSTKNE